MPLGTTGAGKAVLLSPRLGLVIAAVVFQRRHRTVCLDCVRIRPLHDQLHGAYRATLLSHRTKNLNLRGFLNLFLILLFVINFRMVTDNLMEYGKRRRRRQLHLAALYAPAGPNN